MELKRSSHYVGFKSNSERDIKIVCIAAFKGKEMNKFIQDPR